MNIDLSVVIPAVTGTIVVGWLSPWWMARQMNKQAMALKEQDWKRQDAVAAAALAAAEAAREAVTAAAAVAAGVKSREVETARLLAEANVQVAQAAVDTSIKLEKLSGDVGVVHSLVNSGLTASIQAQLDARLETLVALQDRIDEHRAAGREPSVTVSSAVAVVESKIATLKQTLAERLQQQETADAQIKLAAEKETR
jgi:hypothetical protein